jgi:hypothetical protein
MGVSMTYLRSLRGIGIQSPPGKRQSRSPRKCPRAPVGSDVHGLFFGEADGIGDKFDYVKIPNQAGNLPESLAVSTPPELTSVMVTKRISPAVTPMSTTKQDARGAAKPQ